MTVIGYVLVALAFLSYAGIIQAVFKLVAEARQLNSGVRFNRFWWYPAWRIHKTAYPLSSIRKQIVLRFILTFALMSAGMACLAVKIIQNMPPGPGQVH